MKPLYMWAGGKGRMITKYARDLEIPFSGFDYFVEPMFGAGAMTLYIAKHSKNIKRFIINDIKKEIIGIYKAIKTNPKEFIKCCDKYCNKYLPMDKEERKIFYYDVRKEYITQYNKWNYVEEAGTLYFLMKTCFNGIFQATKESKGRFATPSGLLNHKTQVYDKENILRWHEFLQRADLFSGDWKDCVKTIKGRVFYFFDPPYRNSFTKYGEIFDDNSQKEVIDFVKGADKKGNIVMFCGRETGDSFYLENKGHLEISYYNTNYTAGVRATNEDGSRSAKEATEILLYSPSVKKINT